MRVDLTSLFSSGLSMGFKEKSPVESGKFRRCLKSHASGIGPGHAVFPYFGSGRITPARSDPRIIISPVKSPELYFFFLRMGTSLATAVVVCCMLSYANVNYTCTFFFIIVSQSLANLCLLCVIDFLRGSIQNLRVTNRNRRHPML